MTTRIKPLGVVGGHSSYLVAWSDRRECEVMFYVVEQGDHLPALLCSSLGLRLECPTKARAVELVYKVAKWDGAFSLNEGP